MHFDIILYIYLLFDYYLIVKKFLNKENYHILFSLKMIFYNS